MPNVYSKPLHPDINTTNWKLALKDWREDKFVPSKGGNTKVRKQKILLQQLHMEEQFNKAYETSRKLEHQAILREIIEEESKLF